MSQDAATGGEQLALVVPLFSVVRGSPSPEELAALTAVLVSRSGGETNPERPSTSRWADPQARLRRPLHPGAGAWRHSAW